MATNAITMTVWTKTIDSYRDWSAYHAMASNLGALRTFVRVVLVFASCGTVGAMLADMPGPVRMTLAIVSAVTSAITEIWLTEKAIARFREAAAFESSAYDAWMSLWRRLDDVTLAEIDALIESQNPGVQKYAGLAPNFVLRAMAKRAKSTIAPMMNASMTPA